MTPREAEAHERVYGGLGRAIRSAAPVDKLANAAGSPARVAAGVAVYRNNVRAAYLRALQETFPVVERLVGEAFFRYLAHEYFHTHPPKSPLVARYGDALPGFLEKFEAVSTLPYLSDVARLELAWLAAYHAAEARALTPEEIFDAVGDAPDAASFEVHPSLRLLRSRYPVHAIWRHNRDRNKEPLKLESGGERVLIIRPENAVMTSTISSGLFAALEAISDGDTLGGALDRAVAAEPAARPPGIIQCIATSGAIMAVNSGRNI